MPRFEQFGQPPRPKKPEVAASAADTWPLPDIVRRQEIVLPPTVHREMVAAIEQSNRQCQEVGLVYDSHLKQISRAVGPVVQLKARTWRQGQYDYTRIEAGGNVLTQIPVATAGIVYHTHPEFSLQTLSRQGWNERTFTQKSGGMDLSSYIAMWNTTIASFSRFDLEVFFKNDRLMSSMMLGTSRGLRCVTSPPGNAQRKHPQSINSYETDLTSLNELLSTQRVSERDYLYLSDQLLRAFCTENGYVAFGNMDPSSPLLSGI